MTVSMLLWSSVMTWIYSCFWSTGHGAVIYRVISPSRWRCGTVLSYKSMPHAQNVGAPNANSCFWAHAYNPHTATQCRTLSARTTRQRWKHWRIGLSGAIRKKIWFAAFHTNILNWTRLRWREIIKFVGGRDMMAWAMELLDGCPTAPRWTAPDCRRHTLLPQPVE